MDKDDVVENDGGQTIAGLKSSFFIALLSDLVPASHIFPLSTCAQSKLKCALSGYGKLAEKIMQNISQI